MPSVTYIDPHIADYARRGASDFGVYVEGIIEGSVRFTGGFIKFRLVCDPVDDKWRASHEVEGPLAPHYYGWHVRTFDHGHDKPQDALRAVCASARRVISEQRAGARNEYQRSKVDEALRKLAEWEARNLQKSLAAGVGETVVDEVMAGS